jgi:DNA-directed RNA polymerase specialized sigma subunit
MGDAYLADGPCAERWRPLAQHLAERFAVAGGSDEGMVQAAIGAILDVERRLGEQRSGLSLAVPQVIRALRRYRREQFGRCPASARPLPAFQMEIAAAEGELSRRLRRSPTVTEVADHLEVAEDEILAGLEAGWSAGSAG